MELQVQGEYVSHLYYFKTIGTLLSSGQERNFRQLLPHKPVVCSSTAQEHIILHVTIPFLKLRDMLLSLLVCRLFVFLHVEGWSIPRGTWLQALERTSTVANYRSSAVFAFRHLLHTGIYSTKTFRSVFHHRAHQVLAVWFRKHRQNYLGRSTPFDRWITFGNFSSTAFLFCNYGELKVLLARLRTTGT